MNEQGQLIVGHEAIENFKARQAAKLIPPLIVNQSTIDFINKLTAGNFYGSLELTFTGGKVTLIKQVKTIKP